MNNFEIPKKPKSSLIQSIIIALIVIGLFVWGWTGVSFQGLTSRWAMVLKNMAGAFIRPDTSYLQNMTIDGLLYAILETLAIAVAGTFFSAILSLPFALLASQNIVKKNWSRVGKLLVSIVRTFPELILAIIFIKVVGPGAAAGVLALGVHSVGMLGKLFSESIESMDMGPAEALDASGASPFQKLVSAIIPTVLPDFMSYTLYRFEINTRAASTLGLVGAGGIGAPLIFAIGSRNWSRVSMILIALIITVVIVDILSGAVRKRLV